MSQELSAAFFATNSDSSDFDMSETVLMTENPLGMKSRKAIAIVHTLMTRAYNEGRVEDMIGKIESRVHRIKEWAAADADHLKFAKEMDRATKSPSLRIFNLQAQADGHKIMLADHTGESYQEAHLTDQEARYAKMLLDAPKPKYAM